MQTEGLIQFNSWDFIFSMITFFVLFLILRQRGRDQPPGGREACGLQ